MGIDIDAAGDAVTGGLIAGAVEGHGAPAAHDSAHDACLDCGTPLIGPHCYQCGQAAHLHSTAGGFVHEVLHGVFHFEGRIWRTLPMLAFRPGHLTRRYIDGERTKFVSPMALFLFSVFLMFAVAAQLPAWNGIGKVADGFGSGFDSAQQQVGEQAEAVRARIAKREAERALLAKAGTPTRAVDAALADARRELAALEQVGRTMPGRDMVSPKATAKVEGREPTAAEKRNWFEQKIEHARENPKLFLYKMKSAGYKYSWALIPISLPFIWLLFLWKRRFGIYDHAIFATYSLCFMSLLVVALSLLGALGKAGSNIAWVAFFVVLPVHMYKQLRYGYRLSRFGAGWRTVVLLFMLSISASLFFLLLLYQGTAG